MVASGRPGSAEHDIGEVTALCGTSATVRWLRAAATYSEDKAKLRELDGFGQRFQVREDPYTPGMPGGYRHAELYRGGNLVATGLGATRDEAIADVRAQYRIKRARRWAKYAAK
jgi:hypothetical protein